MHILCGFCSLSNNLVEHSYSFSFEHRLLQTFFHYFLLLVNGLDLLSYLLSFLSSVMTCKVPFLPGYMLTCVFHYCFVSYSFVFSLWILLLILIVPGLLVFSPFYQCLASVCKNWEDALVEYSCFRYCYSFIFFKIHFNFANPARLLFTSAV